MSSLATLAIALVAVLIAWKLVKGVFKLLSVGAILVVALVIYTGGIS
jgi:hypothetical protein